MKNLMTLLCAIFVASILFSCGNTNNSVTKQETDSILTEAPEANVSVSSDTNFADFIIVHYTINLDSLFAIAKTPEEKENFWLYVKGKSEKHWLSIKAQSEKRWLDIKKLNEQKWLKIKTEAFNVFKMEDPIAYATYIKWEKDYHKQDSVMKILNSSAFKKYERIDTKAYEEYQNIDMKAYEEYQNIDMKAYELSQK